MWIRYIKNGLQFTWFQANRDELQNNQNIIYFISHFNDSPGQILPILGKFSDVPEKFSELKIALGSVDGFLFDVGASSMQFDAPERGFGLSKDGILDMRMDQGRSV